MSLRKDKFYLLGSGTLSLVKKKNFYTKIAYVNYTQSKVELSLTSKRTVESTL